MTLNRLEDEIYYKLGEMPNFGSTNVTLLDMPKFVTLDDCPDRTFFSIFGDFYILCMLSAHKIKQVYLSISDPGRIPLPPNFSTIESKVLFSSFLFSFDPLWLKRES